MSDVYYQPDDEWWKAAPDYIPAQNGQPPQLTIRPKGNDVTALLNGGAGGVDPNALQALVAPEQPAVAQNALEQRGVIDKLLGLNGPRFQTWPERMVRSAATAPGEAFDTGQLTTRDPYGRVTDQQPVFDVETLHAAPPTIERALDVGGAAFGGGMPAAVKGALGSAGGRLMQPAAEAAPAFYSGVERALEGLTQKSATGDQWLNTLRNRPGVKPEELDWTGVSDYLASKAGEKVSKDDLAKYMAEHRTEIKEVEKGEHTFTHEELARGREDFIEGEGVEPSNQRDLTDWMHSVNEYMDGNHYASSTKYHGYQLPGGDNYRELLLTLPEKRLPELKAGMSMDEYHAQPGHPYRSSHWDEPNVVAHVRMNDRQIPVEFTPEQQAARQAHTDAAPLLIKNRDEQTKVALSIRDESKHLERARKDQILADNKAGKISNVEAMRQLENYEVPEQLKPLQDKLTELRRQEDAIRSKLPAKPEPQSIKSLHLEEIQSDWHQQGKKQGYKGERDAAVQATIDAERKYNVADQRYRADPSEANNQAYLKASEDYRVANQKQMELESKGSTVPDAPFKSTWADLALKRAISKAAREGYDAISWTPGEQQAARYDLSKQVDAIEAHNLGDGHYFISGKRPGSNAFETLKKRVPKEKLAEEVGKDLAEKIIQQNEQVKEYSGLDLKLGDAPMKAFYDKMLVDKANKLAKSMDGKVEWKELPTDSFPGGVKPIEQAGNATSEFMKTAGITHYVENPKAVSGLSYFKSEKEALDYIKSHDVKVPVLRLTPQMKQAAGTGFPLYMRGLPFSFTPVDHDPFKDDKDGQ